jgi:RNA polymerase sigma factor (sigma-70 family)
MSNHELLRRYLRDDSQDAFAVLVSRHVDLVYSAALRQVRLPHLAEEVAQAVFVDLARQAPTLPDDQPLSAWLYVVTRRTAIDVVRREVRRREGEQSAATLATMRTESAGWTEIAAVLDEAMAALEPTDRSAILLRYFENLSLREVGESLGISEDTAQKRVSRAVDRLRLSFAGRGVAVSASAFAAELSAHAVQAAPVGLGAAISTAAVSGAASALASANATNAIVMTTFQKSIAGTVLALAVGTGIYEATAFARQASWIATEEQRASALTAQLRRVDEQHAIAATRLKSTEAQIDSRLASGLGDAALESRLRGWQANLAQLRDALSQRPYLSIPELQLLSDDAWFDAATKAKLNSDDAVRRTLAGLRNQATFLMGAKMRSALSAYLKVNDGILPDRIDQLLPYFNPPIEPVWLERYEILRRGKFSELSNRDRARIIGPKSFGDVEYDLVLTFGPIGGSEANAMDENVHGAMRAFATSNRRQGKTAAELVPYLKWPASEAAVQKFLDAKSAPAATTKSRAAATQPSRP